jgi:hypothetical protein
MVTGLLSSSPVAFIPNGAFEVVPLVMLIATFFLTFHSPDAEASLTFLPDLFMTFNEI